MSATPQTYRIPTARTDLPVGLALGVAFSFVLFVLMALAQLIGEVKKPSNEITETLVAMPPPVVEEIEEPLEPPEPEEEPPPELDTPPPDISLDQLEIALNPGTGGNLAGDFALPTVSAAASDLNSEDFFDFSDLDEPPQLLDKSPFNFPRSLRSKKVSGKVVVFIQLDEQGHVMNARIAESSLPDFNDYVLQEIRRRKFSPPTVQGKAVKAKANLPIPIQIN